MISRFDDLPLPNCENPVGIAHSAETMRYDQAGPPAHEAIESLLNKSFALAVEGAGGLVQNQDSRIAEQRTGNRYPLSLSAREIHTSFSEHGVVSVRK